MIRIFLVLMLLISQGLVASIVAAEETYQKVQVVDPYIELHTGPGRGYPVFHVYERGEWIEVIKRKTDWFQVRGDNGKDGWVTRVQLEQTLTEAGIAPGFRDIAVSDFLERRLEFGFAGGEFENDPVVTARAGYHISENLMLELSVADVAGSFSSSSLYHINLVSMPFPDWRLTPFFTIGVGRFENIPKATLIDAIEIDATAANAGLGVRYYITRRFIARLDFKNYVVLKNDIENEEFQEWVAGLSFFF